MIIPAKKDNARTGSEFAKSIMGISGSPRENAILIELINGNVPDFCRARAHVASINEKIGFSVTFTVIPRFLAIGTNEDHFYTPMTPTTAQAVADAYGAMLPTYKMVQDIFTFASFRQIASPLQYGPQMTSTEWYKKHSDIVVKQLENVPMQALCDGYKKNVIISKNMETKPNSVFIYGWMKDQAGNFWQGLPLFPGHSTSYSDYSHSVRLVDRNMILTNLNDQTATEVDAYDILKDPTLSILLSAEGPLVKPYY